MLLTFGFRSVIIISDLIGQQARFFRGLGQTILCHILPFFPRSLCSMILRKV